MTEAPKTVLKSLTVLITREAFTDFFILTVPKAGGQVYTEELEVDDAVEWFRLRGADPILVEKALDHCWNFYRASVEIVNYREPPVRDPLLAPKLD
jgi:hypothetical protein